MRNPLEFVEAGRELINQAEEIKGWLDHLDTDSLRDRSDTWIFYEGNNARQNIVGSIPRYDDRFAHSAWNVNVKETSWFKNDEARSVLIQRAKRGDVLLVFDSPRGGQDDDWTEIVVKRDLTYLVIGTFEQTHENEFYRIVHHRKNGLDGKVSRVLNHRPGHVFPPT